MPSELPAPPRPWLISLSYWLWFGACVVGMITVVVTLRSFGDLKALVLAIVEHQYPLETPTTREKVARAAVATLIGAGALIVLVQLAFAFMMRSGRGWARFTLVGFTILAALYSYVVFDTASTIYRAGMLASTALMVIAWVPMFLPDTRTWFANRR